MKNFIEKFVTNENCALTFDWVILTIAFVLLGAIIGTSFAPGVDTVAADISNELSSASRSDLSN
ncbi:hypothetical protein EU805_15255 [Salipiger sp. IMCC34102]|uniref:hypothetical protein n=1 Tax=Salipiger sp. IMCC34102 TaxID=2510647 RepID=UPI00101CD3DF|nr:hypothetical protein [Salipiger sp. IMCC34102]RYH01136.1 hypothetical protein EU805_15255 [Salipiger sp. IMCC34102]